MTTLNHTNTPYIVTKRAKFQTLFNRPTNLSYGTECYSDQNGVIYRLKDGLPLCYVESDIAFNYISINRDGQAKKRGELVHLIMDKLAQTDELHQKRWDKLWDDELSNTLRDQGLEDFWWWARPFYDAPISSLEHIWELIKDM